MASVRRGQSLQEQQAPVQATGPPQSQVYSRVFQFAPSDPPLHSRSQASRSEDPLQASRARVQRIHTECVFPKSGVLIVCHLHLHA